MPIAVEYFEAQGYTWAKDKKEGFLYILDQKKTLCRVQCREVVTAKGTFWIHGQLSSGLKPGAMITCEGCNRRVTKCTGTQKRRLDNGEFQRCGVLWNDLQPEEGFDGRCSGCKEHDEGHERLLEQHNAQLRENQRYFERDRRETEQENQRDLSEWTEQDHDFIDDNDLFSESESETESDLSSTDGEELAKELFELKF